MRIKKEDIGGRIKEVREGLKMTQAELGRILGVGNKAVSSYEKGAANPSPSSLAEIARLGERTIDWLVTGKDPQLPQAPAISREKALEEIAVVAFGRDKEFAFRVCEAAGVYTPPERLSEDEKQLLSAYRCASDEIREEAFGMLERSAKRSQGSGGGENGLSGRKSA